MQVVDSGDRAMATGAISKFDINLDSYCTWHMTACFLLEKPVPCVVDVVVGNKERLQSTYAQGEHFRLYKLYLFSFLICLPIFLHKGINFDGECFIFQLQLQHNIHASANELQYILLLGT